MRRVAHGPGIPRQLHDEMNRRPKLYWSCARLAAVNPVSETDAISEVNERRVYGSAGASVGLVTCLLWR